MCLSVLVDLEFLLNFRGVLILLFHSSQFEFDILRRIDFSNFVFKLSTDKRLLGLMYNLWEVPLYVSQGLSLAMASPLGKKKFLCLVISRKFTAGSVSDPPGRKDML